MNSNLIIEEKIEKNEKHIGLHDIIIFPLLEDIKHPPTITGEFTANIEDYSTFENDNESAINRIYSDIHGMLDNAVEQHIKNGIYDPNKNKIVSGYEDEVTRLITSEFFFYTKFPLTLSQFERLQQKLFDIAKTMPDNIHMVLGTFAVFTPDGKVMNVIPLIECGKRASIRFAMKSHTSSADPVYMGMLKHNNQEFAQVYHNANTTTLPNPDINIKIDDQPCNISYNNIFECKTYGDSAFFVPIEICLDHTMGVAKEKFHSLVNQNISMLLSFPQTIEIKKLSLKCSHVVSSYTVTIKLMYLLGDFSQSDPRRVKIVNEDTEVFSKNAFCPAYKAFSKQRAECGYLLETELNIVNLHNEICDDIKQNKKVVVKDIIEKVDNYFATKQDALIWAIDNNIDPIGLEIISEMKIKNRDPEKTLSTLKRLRKILFNLEKKTISIAKNMTSPRWNDLKDDEKIFVVEKIKTLSVEIFSTYFDHYVHGRLAASNSQLPAPAFDENEINNIDSVGYAPLHWAILLNDVESVKKILSNKSVDLSIENNTGMLPFKLAEAIDNNEIKVIIQAKLLEQFHTALQNKNLKTIQTVIASGLELNQPLPTDENNATPFIKLIEYCLKSSDDIEAQIEIMKFCLNNDGNIFTSDKLNRNVMNIVSANPLDAIANVLLQHAIIKQDVLLVEKLLKNKINPNFKDELGDSSLFYALDGKESLKRISIVSLLLEFAADHNIKNNDGNSPLDIAIKNTQLKAIVLFANKKMAKAIKESNYIDLENALKNGADPNTKDKAGSTFLYQAIVNQADKDIINLLLKYGADPTIVNNFNISSIQAAEKFYTKMVNTLQSAVKTSSSSALQLLSMYSAPPKVSLNTNQEEQSQNDKRLHGHK